MLEQIAKELGVLYRGKAEIEHNLDEQDREYAARLLALTPAEGWPGKNEQERKTAYARAEAGDEILGRMRAQLKADRERRAQASGNIAALEAERRAEEWAVLKRLAEGRAPVDVDVNREPAKTAAVAALVWDEALAEIEDQVNAQTDCPF